MIAPLYAFILGMASLISPCSFIAVPTLVAHSNTKPGIIARFILGYGASTFALVFASLAFGTLWTATNGFWITLAAGIVTALSGFTMLGMIHPSSTFGTRRLDLDHPMLSGFMIGGVSLSCVGPALAALFALELTQPSLFVKTTLALAFVAGSTTPFFLYGKVLSQTKVKQLLHQHAHHIQRASGIIMLIMSAFMISIGLSGATR